MKKNEKNWDEDDLEIIIVTSGSSEEVKLNKKKKVVMEEPESDDEKPSILTLNNLPREVYVKMLSYLDVEDIVKISLLSKRYYRVTEREEVWDYRYNRWMINFNGDDDVNKNRYFYLKQYKIHLAAVKAAEERDRRERAIARKNRNLDSMDLIMKAVWYNKFTFDFLAATCIALWTVLMPLKLDRIIDWSWHYIYFPWYVFIIHFLIGISTLDIISFCYADEGLRTFMYKTISDGYSFMVIFAKTQIFRGIIYLTAACFLSFFMLIAEYHQSHSFPEHIIWIPVAILLIGWLLTFCTGCGQFNRFCTCRSGERYLFIVPWCYMVWLFIFLWVKSTDLVTFSWGVALLPLWIIFGAAFLMSVTGGFFFLCDGGGEKYLVGLMAFGYISILAPLLVWLAFIVDNLESMLHSGEIPRPWIIAFIPGYIIQIIIFIICGLMTKALKRF